MTTTCQVFIKTSTGAPWELVFDGEDEAAALEVYNAIGGDMKKNPERHGAVKIEICFEQ